ncbi:Peptidase M13, domain 2 [Fusarium oxysporum f. sp. vasinfectum]|nr:Peptidase M13, domain 2 [Fusarium oxysporum f. sp. vasinfectum]
MPTATSSCMKLSNNYASYHEVRPPQAELPIAVSQKLAPQLNYEYVVKQLAPEGWTDALLAQNPSYFQECIRDSLQYTSRNLQAYFVWKIIISLSPYVESDLTNAYNDLYLKINNKDAENPTPRWKRYNGWPNWSDMEPLALRRGEALWSQGDQTVFGARRLSIKGSFAERIETREWATSKVKKVAIEKLEAMEKLVGLPTDPNAVDPIALQNYYADIEVKSSLAINVLAFAKLRVAKK